MVAYDPPIGAFYSQLKVPTHMSPGLMIGQNGQNFKKITTSSSTDYIWFNGDKNVIEIWSWTEENIKHAKRLLHTLMYKCPNPSYELEITENTIKGPYHEVFKHYKTCMNNLSIDKFEKCEDYLIKLTVC